MFGQYQKHTKRNAFSWHTTEWSSTFSFPYFLSLCCPQQSKAVWLIEGYKLSNYEFLRKRDSLTTPFFFFCKTGMHKNMEYIKNSHKKHSTNYCSTFFLSIKAASGQIFSHLQIIVKLPVNRNLFFVFN